MASILSEQFSSLAQASSEAVTEGKSDPFLSKALDWVAAAYPECRGLHQVGRKQVWKFYEAHGHLTATELTEYALAFKRLWQWLGRTGKPPSPKAAATPAPNKAKPQPTPKTTSPARRIQKGKPAKPAQPYHQPKPTQRTGKPDELLGYTPFWMAEMLESRKSLPGLAKRRYPR